jgi:hypothetical protein
MNDREFKNLKHLAKGYRKHSDGGNIEKNYQPDFSLVNGEDFILLEHESEPNRKTILADMIKAAHFLQNDKTGILIIVMTPKGTSSLGSYPKHIQAYLDWIGDKTNLKTVYFIDETDYETNGQCITINSKLFTEVATKIEKCL